MLAGHSILSYASRHLALEICSPSVCRRISTNTAINRSLRRSSFRSPATKATQLRSTRAPRSGSQHDGLLKRTRRLNDKAESNSLGSRGLRAKSRLTTRSSSEDVEHGARRRALLNARHSRATPNQDLKFSLRESRMYDQSPIGSERTDHRVEGTSHLKGDQKRYEQRSQRHERRFSDQDEKSSPIYESHMPLQIPYTTPASEFLYGTSVVAAALNCTRRKLYKLYIYAGDNREARDQDHRLRKSALSRGIIVEQVKRDWLRLMDKMSQGRPHNGYILEASPLPKLPATSLCRVRKPNDVLTLTLDHQSQEDKDINGTDPTIEYKPTLPRYPFVVLLDGILDPGNLGAILRSAYFLGVDAVAVADRNSAPFSPVALKASAGASEELPLVSVAQSGSFIDRCKANDWKIYAAVAPASSSKSLGTKFVQSAYHTTTSLGNPLKDHPCVLILGGEGEGLPWRVQQKADKVVSIDGQRSGKGGVDSLNVSVAAGLLFDAFLRKPAIHNGENISSGGSSSSSSIQSNNEDRLF